MARVVTWVDDAGGCFDEAAAALGFGALAPVLDPTAAACAPRGEELAAAAVPLAAASLVPVWSGAVFAGAASAGPGCFPV
jgi:hypothetical protein